MCILVSNINVSALKKIQCCLFNHCMFACDMLKGASNHRQNPSSFRRCSERILSRHFVISRKILVIENRLLLSICSLPFGNSCNLVISDLILVVIGTCSKVVCGVHSKCPSLHDTITEVNTSQNMI